MEKEREVFVGNLGSDPEFKYTRSSKKPVCHLNVGVSEGEQTVWKKVLVWGDKAEMVSRALKKGMKVFVQGRKSIYKYKTEGGEEKQVPNWFADSLATPIY